MHQVLRPNALLLNKMLRTYVYYMYSFYVLYKKNTSVSPDLLLNNCFTLKRFSKVKINQQAVENKDYIYLSNQ